MNAESFRQLRRRLNKKGTGTKPSRQTITDNQNEGET